MKKILKWNERDDNCRIPYRYEYAFIVAALRAAFIGVYRRIQAAASGDMRVLRSSRDFIFFSFSLIYTVHSLRSSRFLLPVILDSWLYAHTCIYAQLSHMRVLYKRSGTICNSAASDDSRALYRLVDRIKSNGIKWLQSRFAPGELLELRVVGLTIISIISITHLDDLRGKRYVLPWKRSGWDIDCVMVHFYFAVKKCVPPQRHD